MEPRTGDDLTRSPPPHPTIKVSGAGSRCVPQLPFRPSNLLLLSSLISFISFISFVFFPLFISSIMIFFYFSGFLLFSDVILFSTMYHLFLIYRLFSSYLSFFSFYFLSSLQVSVFSFDIIFPSSPFTVPFFLYFPFHFFCHTDSLSSLFFAYSPSHPFVYLSINSYFLTHFLSAFCLSLSSFLSLAPNILFTSSYDILLSFY